MSTIFSKIIAKEIPADIVYEDDLVLAFKDIAPQAPVHILIIPKKEIPTVNDVAESDEAVLGRMLTVAAKIAKDSDGLVLRPLVRRSVQLDSRAHRERLSAGE